ncbi:rod shape-determining protein RodA [Candidatus Microgenomates bacterium]|nr:MAG: rod shape-determining protein RodA [Candidatus Microgenomates bacterium]
MGRRAFDLNWLILICVIILTTLGLTTILSIDTDYFYQQVVFALVGAVFAYILSRIQFSIFQYFDRLLIIFCVIFLLLSYLGPSVRGATRWIMVGSINIQPSEFVKPLYLLALSSLLVRFPPVKLKPILAHTGLFLLIFFIVLKQPDLGSAIVYATMWVSMMILAGIPVRYIIAAFFLGLVILPAGYESLAQYQRLRILNFFDPMHDPQGTGYNAIQSMISVGSGKLFGRGFGRGTQSLLRFLPERHTDFIFASYTEEFGFVGALALLVVFFVLLWQLLREAGKKILGSSAYLYICGFVVMILTHIIINIGMNMGIVPITGITLPFVSYGGSSLLATFVGLGIAISAMQRGNEELEG